MFILQLGENLRAYYKTWKSNRNASNSLTGSVAASNAIQNARSLSITTTIAPSALPAVNAPSAGLKPSAQPPTSNVWQLSTHKADTDKLNLVRKRGSGVLEDAMVDSAKQRKLHNNQADDGVIVSGGGGIMASRCLTTTGTSNPTLAAVPARGAQGETGKVPLGRRPDRKKKDGGRVRHCAKCGEGTVCLGRGPGGAAACDEGRGKSLINMPPFTTSQLPLQWCAECKIFCALLKGYYADRNLPFPGDQPSSSRTMLHGFFGGSGKS